MAKYKCIYFIHVLLYMFFICNIVEPAPPAFDYFPSPVTISEDTAIGTIIFTCNATDPDDPETAAGQIRYGITSPRTTPALKWVVDPGTCDFYVNTALDADTKDSYRIGITLKDVAGEVATPRYVDIILLEKNDNAPFCAERAVLKTVPEDTAPNAEIDRLACTDADKDPTNNGKVLYKLSDTNSVESKAYFDIDITTGSFTLKQSLDRETIEEYQVNIDVYDGGIPSLTTTVIYTILVGDIDDNIPTWPTNPIFESVRELEPLNNMAFQIAAVDLDEANTAASTIKYKIQTPGNPDWFDIDSETGAVRVKGQMDYNIAPWVTMEVLAYSSDKVNDFNTVTLNISIIDENSVVPKFDQDTYEANITENSPPGTFVINVHADDPEQGISGQVEYFTASSVFNIDSSTGEVTVNSNIDFEANKVYTIRVEARDKGLTPKSGYAFLLVNVIPVNEFDPTITNPGGTLDLDEDAFPGNIIYNFTASDDDDGLDGVIIFSLVNPSAPFTVESSEGILAVARPLDRETQQQWEIEVVVADKSDTNPRSSTSTLTINIQDVNDNRPICDPLPNAVITLPHPIGTKIGTINCMDLDDGSNGDLIFTKSSGDAGNSFSVNNAGEIILDSSPTETEDNIVFFIEDQGSPALNATVVLKVIAELEFSLSNLPANINVSENTNLATELFDVDDCCVFSPTVYEIISGNEDNHVIIDPASGRVILMNAFDRETKQNFRYEIQATAVETSTTINGFLDVFIQDTNDNQPKFDISYHLISVSENYTIGALITNLQATDKDIGVNADLSYIISTGNADGKFRIDNTGDLYLDSVLDAENVNSYSLEIIAQDNGLPAVLSSSMVLDIEVKNVDEISPKFLNINGGVVYTNISEAETLGAPVFSVNAEDEDLNTVLTYLISQGNDDQSFVIDSSSGTIVLAKLLDRETTPMYNLTVIVQTSDNDTISAVVSIDVLDVNDKDPKFSQDVYQLEVTHEDPANTLVTSFIITDDDIGTNKDIASLTIEDGDPDDVFKIVGSQLLTNKAIDYYNRNLYSLTLKATDSGLPTPRSGYARVNIRVLPKFKPPKFLSNQYSSSVDEGISPGSEVIDLSATADGGIEGESGTILYSIRNGNDDKKFFISDFTGQIGVRSTIDFETTEDYSLVIDAVSREDASLSASTTVSIDIQNVNDNVPIFSANVYSFEVDEDSNINDTIGSVAASDADKPPYADVVFTPEPSAGSTDFFISSTGELRVAKTLDFLRQSFYSIIITASDGGKTGQATINIKIIDVNNHDPIFTPDSFEVTVSESIGTGLTFYTAKAEDLDSGANGEIKYTLVSGNTNNLLALNDTSGALTVQSALDRETHETFYLVIRAEDKASTGARSGTLSLTVQVLDVNDETPVFPQSLRDATINRSDVPGTQVIKVTATDSDMGSNAAITYAISDGNSDGLFIIDLNTGDIKTASSVTTAENEYNLKITANDKGVPVRSSTMTVVVKIIPIKVFGSSEQTMQIIEELPAGPLSPVTPKVGHDPSATLKYEITGGNFGNYFGINENTGLLSTLKPIDRENFPFFILTIRISDDFSVDYTKTVAINVLDLNDNSPQMSTASTTVDVVENTPSGQIIAVFEVNDIDTGNNSVVDLSIGATPPEAVNLFEITGLYLRTKQSFDFETSPSHTVTVIATDRGTPQQTGSVILTVNVIDVNDQLQLVVGSPEVPSIYISRETSYNTPNGDTVTVLTPEDFGQAAGNEATYKNINQDGMFSVDDSGNVVVRKSELLKPNEKYFVWVVATIQTPTETKNTLGLLRIDTFDPNIHIVSLESSLDVGSLESNREDLIQRLESAFPVEDIPKIWRLQSYTINARRKLLATGSQALAYVLRGPVPGSVRDVESDKQFYESSELLNILRLDPSRDEPQAFLTPTIVSVNGYSEPVLPKTEPITQQFVTSTEGYITFAAIALIFLIFVLLLICLYYYKKKKSKREREGSTENLVYTDPTTNTKKVAITVPTGTGKKKKNKTGLPANKTTRKISLGPASTALPTLKPRKKSSVTTPVVNPESLSVDPLTPVQTPSVKASVLPEVTKQKQDQRGIRTTEKKSLPAPRVPAGTSPVLVDSAEKSAPQTEITQKRNGPVVKNGKQYDGVGYENGKKYAYNTRTGSTLWEDKNNGLGTGGNIRKKKAEPKLTVVSEAKVTASPNLSART